MSEGYLETDLRGNLTFFNPAACTMLKYSPEELQGLDYQRIMDMETVPEVAEAFGKVYRTGVGLSLIGLLASLLALGGGLAYTRLKRRPAPAESLDDR